MKNIFTFYWVSQYTEFRIEVDVGAGYFILVDNYTTNKVYSYTTDIIEIDVKITPYIASVLTPSEALETTYTIPGTPTNLAIVGDIDDTVVLSWDAVADADEYVISLQYMVEKISKSTIDLTTTFTITDLVDAGGAWPEFWIYVYAKTDVTVGLPAKILIQAPIPTQVLNAVIQERLSASVILSWDEVSGATGYKIYQGLTDDFDPATDGDLVYDGESPIATITALDFTTDYIYYFKVATYNHYNQDRTVLIFSDIVIVEPIDGELVLCRTYDDADVSGAPKLIRLRNSFGTYFYIKVYPTVSATANGTSDNIGFDLYSIDETDLSGTAKVAEFQSGGIKYYFKVFPTVAANVENVSGTTLYPVIFWDKILSGTARVAEIEIGGSSYYFKVYPTKTV